MLEQVSIIVIVYNSEKTLSKCLDSCISQTYKNIEIVVVNDGSTDNSYAIAKSFQENDERIRLISKKNEGIPRTRRAGFEQSSGAYIYHLDADDYLEPEAIEVLLKTLNEEKADIVIGGLILEDREGELITNWISNLTYKSRTDYLKDIFSTKMPPFIFGRLIKREMYEPVLVPSEFNCGEDIISNVMMVCHNPQIKIVSHPGLIQHYLIYSSSLTNSSSPESFMKYTDLIEQILIQFDFEKLVMQEWAYFRVIKSWRHYLRRGGKQYLADIKYLKNFYFKYYSVVRKQLTLMEQLELNLYRYNQFIGYQFSRVYCKCLRLMKQQVN
jgi:glycosyltransferase involved in cell wall biosynthesis